MESSQYDADYTMQISKNMMMPEKIAFNGHDHGNMESDYQHINIGKSARDMNVPGKIMLAGQDQHIGMREDIRLDFDAVSSVKSSNNYVAIQTPPRVITLDERPFPAVIEDSSKRFTPSRRHNGMHTSDSPIASQDALDPLSTSLDGLLLQDIDEEDSVVVRRQMIKLTRRIMNLEEENSKRSQREMFVYPIAIGYLLFQIAKWFLRND